MTKITQIQQKDLPELSALLEELSGLKTNYDLLTHNFNWMAENEDYHLLGARYNGHLAGTLMGIICHDLVGDCKPFMVIENVIVSEKYRRLGIGKMLMQEIENIGRQRGCYYTILVSGANRKEAHKFYDSLGYTLNKVQGFKKFL